MQVVNYFPQLKQSHNFDTEKRKALTVEEQKLFLTFLKNSRQYNHWYPIFALMLGSGLRVGEATGLRWCDVDLEAKEIDVNHTLVYYNHAQNGCYFGVNTPKTKAGNRTVPILDLVRDALLQEKEHQTFNELECKVTVDAYTKEVILGLSGTK